MFGRGAGNLPGGGARKEIGQSEEGIMFSLCRVLLKLAGRRALRSQGGVTAIEYALIAGITVLAIVAGAMAVGASLSGFFTSLAGRFPP
jgi:Flp pilus assembly pilin Flp